jgi:hypothetical protein
VDKFENITNEDLATLATEKRAAFDALLAIESPTVAQVDEAEALATEIEEIVAEQEHREEMAAQAAEKFAALKNREFGKKVSVDSDMPEADSPEDGEKVDPDAPAEVDSDPDEVEREADEEAKKNSGGAPQSTARSQSIAATVARKTKRPAPPTFNRGSLSLTAAAEVPDYAQGARLNGIEDLAQAVIKRSQGFTPPTGDGKSEDIRKFGVASIRREFPKELTIDRGTDDMEVLERAAKETRLPGNSLVAAGGWCAPSETMYDLCGDESSLEGLISLPEVNVARGGINYTTGPDFTDFYTTANGFFVQTEAQAIAGATKPCVTVDCPPFQEVRMDAVGLCIKIPILTNATWPELIQRYVSGFLTAYQHRLSANIITRMLALTGAAKVYPGLGSTVIDTLEGLTLIAQQRRERLRMAQNGTLEVILPMWVRGALLADLAARGNDAANNEALLNSMFAARGFNVQWVYNWQQLPDNSLAYPATFNALMYPAGTFIKGTKDVINLSTIYDAASLAVNVYTGLFMEEGLLVAKMCNDADLVTLPVCNAGRLGAGDLTCV